MSLWLLSYAYQRRLQLTQLLITEMQRSVSQTSYQVDPKWWVGQDLLLANMPSNDYVPFP